jgi:serine protease Do
VNEDGPAVVSIEHTLYSVNSFGQKTPSGTAIGSGFIIDQQGDIVTNNHVISGGNPHYTVTFENGGTAPATLVGANATYDLAVIRVKVPVPATVSWGNSADVQPGESILAIGDPLGDFPNSVTSGIVSGLHRSLAGTCATSTPCDQDYIQIDAPINHGNSGGPLIDMSGQVVGINTAIERSTGSSSGGLNLFGDPTQSDPNSTVAEGLGFAIASDTAQPIVEHLIQHTPLPYLGVCYHSVTLVNEARGIPAGAQLTGGCVSSATNSITPGSPAAKARLHTNDVIVAVGNLDLSNGLTLIQAVLPQDPGSTAPVKIWRPSSASSTSGTYLTKMVTFGKFQ